IGAEAEFGQEYGELVNVYFIADPNTGEAFSREFCGGPHVKNTSELGKSGAFKIVKEQSSGAGIRRIKAVLE
ncbi:MAG TPA: alanine--tRNA ligase, partial [bacterium]|nr:alanine--tRNA ligase [bacterium]